MQRIGILSLLLYAAALSFAQNIDILEPIMRAPPSTDSDNNTFFGYSTVLHRRIANPTDFNSHLANTM